MVKYKYRKKKKRFTNKRKGFKMNSLKVSITHCSICEGNIYVAGVKTCEGCVEYYGIK